MVDEQRVLKVISPNYNVLTKIMLNLAEFCNKDDSITVSTEEGEIIFKVT